MKHVLVTIPEAGEVDAHWVLRTLFPDLARDCVGITDNSVLHHRTGIQVSVHTELPTS